MILWHERLTAGPDGAARARALLELADTLSLADTDGAGLWKSRPQQRPRSARGGGAAQRRSRPGRAAPGDGADRLDARGIAEGLADGELAARAAAADP